MGSQRSSGEHERRRHPRLQTGYRAEVTSGLGARQQAVLYNLSEGGCGLALRGALPPFTVVGVRCNIAGVGLHFQGRIAWQRAQANGTVCGIAIEDFASDADAVFHGVVLGWLIRPHARLGSTSRQAGESSR